MFYYRNHGSHFEKQGVAFSEDARENARDVVDDEKLSDVRSEDHEKA